MPDTTVAVPSPSVTADVFETTLDNGLKVLLKEAHHAPIVCVSVWYRAGSKHESAGTTGLAHLLEHMMFKGTARFGKGEFDRILKENGADNNATTWLDRTNYYELVAADRVETALILEADRMRGALFTQQDLQDEMPVVRNELERDADEPNRETFHQVQSVAFQAHPYHWPTIGWRSDVEAITAEDIRSFYDRYYHPNNAFLVLVGDFDTREMLETVKKHFGPIPAGPAAPRLRTVEPPQKGERRVNYHSTGGAPFLLAAFKSPPPTHADIFALDVLAQILGQGRTSRLFEALVKPGLATSASAVNLGREAQDPYLFFLDAEVAPGQDPELVEYGMWMEVDRIKTEGVTEAELARAKKQNRVDFIYARDRVASLAFALGEAEVHIGYQFLDHYLPNIEAVTSADVQRVAATWLVETTRTVGWYLPTGEGFAVDVDGVEDNETPEHERVGLSHDIPDELHTHEHAMPLSRYGGGVPAAPVSRGEGGGPLIRVPRPVMTHRRVLDNGMTVLVRENHLNQTIDVRGMVHAGSIWETSPGQAWATAQMLERGTTDRDADTIAQMLESAGAHVSFDASRETLRFGAQSITEDFSMVVGLVGEMMTRPAFPEDELLLVKSAGINELRRQLDNTGVRATLLGYEELFGPGNPWSRLTEGTVADVSALSRNQLLTHHQAMVTPERTIVSVVGDVDPDAVFKLMEHSWQGAPRGTRPQLEQLRSFTRDRRVDTQVRRQIELADKNQIDIVLVRQGVSREAADYHAAYVANFIFGGDFSSRLNKELRDNQGLTYATYSRFVSGYSSGPWVASLGVNPGNLTRGIDGILTQLRRFVAEGATAEELNATQRYLTGSHPVRLETNGAIASSLIDAAMFAHSLDYVETYPQVIASLTLDDINAAIVKYFDADKVILVTAGTHPA